MTRDDIKSFISRCLQNSERKELVYDDILPYCLSKCPICNIRLNYKPHAKGGNAELDRIIPGAKGGKYVKDNINVICRKCNGMKGDKDIVDIYNDIAKRVMIAWFQRLSIPESLKRMTMIHKYLGGDDIRVPNFLILIEPNYFFKLGGVYVKIQDGKRYRAGDIIKITKVNGDIVEKNILVIRNNIAMIHNKEKILKSCKCGNVIFYRIQKGKDGLDRYGSKTSKINVCLLCHKTRKVGYKKRWYKK